MTTTHNTETLKRLIAELGLSPEALQRSLAPVPTLAEYLPRVIAASPPGARRTYSTYWTRILDAFGDRRLDQITATDIQALMRTAMDTPVIRRNSRGGTSAGEHLLLAMRTIYQHAVADELIAHTRNPASRVPKPPRPPGNRRALGSAELAAINTAVATTGNDTTLDSLLVRLHIETACRRGGALSLQNQDIDPDWCLVRLREKNNALRWQPASPTLIKALTTHRDQRGADSPPDAQLLRYRDGAPITSRRYDHLWDRIGHHLPWVAAQNISTHWLRHTTITWVERNYGYGIARAYAGHTDTRSAPTTTYIRAQLHEIATALAALTGESHPLAGQPKPPNSSSKNLPVTLGNPTEMSALA